MIILLRGLPSQSIISTKTKLNLGSCSHTQHPSKRARPVESVEAQVQQEVDVLSRAASSTVLVVGSGPAGVELATTVADKLARRAQIQLISTGKLPHPKPGVNLSENFAALVSQWSSRLYTEYCRTRDSILKSGLIYTP